VHKKVKRIPYKGRHLDRHLDVEEDEYAVFTFNKAKLSTEKMLQCRCSAEPEGPGTGTEPG
jgi:hypothetical protein